MKQKLIVTAVAAVLSAAAGSAFALTPWNGVGQRPANTFNQTQTQTQVFISGSSDQNSVLDGVVRHLCVDGSLDAYSTVAQGTTVSNQTGGQTVYSCNIKPGTALDTAATPANSPIWIHKESLGGSVNGISPVANATPLQFVDISKIVAGQTQCTVVPSATVAAAGSLAAKKAWSCPTTMTVAAAPQIGLSDVDLPILLGTSNATGTAGTLNFLFPIQMTMGLAVTVPLRNALQGAQGMTVGSEAADQQPSLSEAYLRRLFQSSKVNTGTTLGIAGDAKRIYPLRRSATAGNQKFAETYLFNLNIVPARISVTAFYAPTTAFNGVLASANYVAGTVVRGACGDATLAPTPSTVFAGISTEQVVNCLNRHAAGGRYAVANLPMTFNAFANPASSSAAIDPAYPTGFRYLKLKGYLPTLENVVRGNYAYYAETVIASLLPLTDTTAAGSVLNALNSELGASSTVAAIDGTFTRWTDLPAGRQNSGVIVPARNNACKATFTTMGTSPDTDPANFATRNPSGALVSNGVPPIGVCPQRF
jgi:hypothetical protein